LIDENIYNYYDFWVIRHTFTVIFVKYHVLTFIETLQSLSEGNDKNNINNELIIIIHLTNYLFYFRVFDCHVLLLLEWIHFSVSPNFSQLLLD